MRALKRSLASAVVVAALLGAACSNKAGGVVTPPADAAKALTGAGATFPAPLYQRWGSEYLKAEGVQINYQSIGSGGGIQQITAKTVDFGASDAPMKDEELTKAPGILHIPTVFGAVVVAYHLPNFSGELRLDGDTVAGIFLGQIKTWNDSKIKALNPNASLPSTAVAVVHRSDGSGTTNIFTSYLDAVSAAWHTKVGKGKDVAWPVGEGGKGNEGVSAAVKQTPGAVGYVELAYATQNTLAFATLKNKAGSFVKASLDSVTAAAAGAQIPEDLRFSIVDAPGDGSYPIAGATWLLVYKDQTDAAKGRALVAFLRWALNDGQAFAKELLYAPLPDSLKATALAKVASITVNGRSL